MHGEAKTDFALETIIGDGEERDGHAKLPSPQDKESQTEQPEEGSRKNGGVFSLGCGKTSGTRTGWGIGENAVTDSLGRNFSGFPNGLLNIAEIQLVIGRYRRSGRHFPRSLKVAFQLPRNFSVNAPVNTNEQEGDRCEYDQILRTTNGERRG
jgi:hypothetical protein